MNEIRYGNNPNNKECCFYVVCEQDKQLEKLKEIKSALKIQESIKEKIKEKQEHIKKIEKEYPNPRNPSVTHNISNIEMEVSEYQSLVEKSKEEN